VDTVGLHATSRQRWVLALVGVGSFMVALDVLVVTTALSTIRLRLGATIETLEWTVNAYNLSFAVLMVTGAALGDRFGRRRVYASGLLLFTAASAACGLSPSVGWLIVARAVQGAGAALVVPVGLTLLGAAYPPERRAGVIGVNTGVVGLGTFLGPFVGGAVVQGLAWQWIFWINVPIGLAALALVLARIEESRGPNSRLDVGGLLLVTGAALGVVWGLVRGNAAGWAGPEVVGAMGAGVLLGIAFVAWERRVEAPMLPMRFFRLRQFSAGNAVNVCLYASQFGSLFLLGLYLQAALGYGPLGAGLRLMPWTAALMVCAPVSGALADRVGERWFTVSGLALQAAGMGWLALIATPHLAYGAMVPPLVAGGAGLSVAMPATLKSIVSAVPLPEIGKASGAAATLRFLGAVLGIAVMTAVFARVGGFASAQAFSRGFAAAMGVAAGLALLGAVVGLAMPGRRPAVEETAGRRAA
jgi:EmrB/QacA subfamily drug resistance transporter